MMDQNVTYFQANPVPRSTNSGVPGQNGMGFHGGSTIEFHPTTSANYTTNANSFHGNETTATFIANSQPQRIAVAVPNGAGINPQTVQVVQLPAGTPVSSQQHILITTQPVSTNPAETDDRRVAAFMEYFVEQPAIPTTTVQSIGGAQYDSNQPLVAKYGMKSKMSSIDKSEREQIKRAKQAEAARQRYHRLSQEEKKALNLKRTLAQKRKRQREREMAELEAILRQTNDIIDDPEVTEQLRERRMRARWAEAARTRYQRMSSEERRAHNTKRRLRQMTVKNDKGEIIRDEDAIRNRIKEQNAKKAEAARLRYHRMTSDKKKLYNQRRTEAFRRRRMEEEALLAMPIGRINGEALDRAQQIVVRNAKRAEAARLRYQRMTPEQRKVYNQKRYTPKRKRELIEGEPDVIKTGGRGDEEFDALSSLERDVLRRTQQAQQVLLRQRQSYATTGAGGPTNQQGPSANTANVNSGAIMQQQQNNATHIITTPASQPSQAVHVQAVPVGTQLRQIQYTTAAPTQQQQQPTLLATYHDP